MARETALPLAFLARMAALLDEEFPSFLATLNQTPLSALRVNTLKLSPSQFEALDLWPTAPVPWCPDGFLLDRKANTGLHPLHDAGVYYIQEPSTMAVATLLSLQPGERVLDLAASPGGKATHLAALLQGRGLLVANEIDRQRADILRYNLERWGTRNAVVLSETPERLADRWPGAFDRVLVDAPCSGEGMFRKNEEARHHWSESHVAGCARRQGNILEAAARLVRPGGWLAYATCTFAPEENEGAVWDFLQSHPDFGVAEPRWLPGFDPGHPEWRGWPQQVEEPEVSGDQAVGENHGQAATHGRSPEALRHTVRLWPHKVEGEGHFVALLRKRGDTAPAAWPLATPVRLASADEDALRDFWLPLISLSLPERLAVYPRSRTTVEVFALTPDSPDLAGLRTVRPGWHLGSLVHSTGAPGAGRSRFVPGHALALGLKSHEVRQRLDEPIGGELAARYLRGETLDVPGPDGWLLVTIAGFPLGWGKRSHGVIKNHYPKALRWL